MQEFTIGAGLASLSFWFFIGAIVIGGIWNDIRKKDAQQKTIRSIIESGKDIDVEVVNTILAKTETDPAETSYDLKIASIIVFFVSIGLGIFGLVLGKINEDAVYALLGISGLVMCVSAGLWFASRLKHPGSN